MPFFSGLAQGFSEAQTQDRVLQQQKDEADAQREQTVLTHLLSHNDPEVRASALTAMLDPRRKPADSFTGRFFNRTQQSPMFPTIRALMAKDAAQGATGGAPAPMPMGGSMTFPPAGTPAVGDVAPQPTAPAGPPRPTGMPTPAQLKGQEAEETAKGHIKGTLEGADLAFPAGAPPSGDPNHDAALKSLVKARALGIAPVHSYDAEGNLHITLGDQEIAAVPSVGKPTAMAAGVETQAANLFARAAAAGQPITMDQARSQARTAQATTTEAKQTSTIVAGQNAAPMAAARLQKLRQQATEAELDTEKKRRGLNGELSAAEAAHTAATFLAGHPGATSDDFNDMVAALSGGAAGSMPTVPAAATPPPAATAGGVPIPTATAPPPAATTPAAKPGLPPGKSLYKPNAQEQGTLDTITAARPMMERVRGLIAGHETENTWGNTFRGAQAELQTMVGHNPSSPMYAQLDPLIQHLKVFALGPYLHGIRNGAFVKAVSDNTPSLLDTPARISQKLDNLEQNFRDIEAAVGSAKPKAGGAPASAAPPAGGVPVGTKRVIKGVPAHWDGAGWVPDAAQ